MFTSKINHSLSNKEHSNSSLLEDIVRVGLLRIDVVVENLVAPEKEGLRELLANEMRQLAYNNPDHSNPFGTSDNFQVYWDEGKKRHDLVQNIDKLGFSSLDEYLAVETKLEEIAKTAHKSCSLSYDAYSQKLSLEIDRYIATLPDQQAAERALNLAKKKYDYIVKQ